MTKRESVKNLCKAIVTRLENHKAIEFPPRLRQSIWEELYGKIGPSILTDEDVRDKAIERLHIKAEDLSEVGMTESDQFKAAKKMIKDAIGDNEAKGLYYQMPMRNLAETVGRFLMSSKEVEEVFLDDEELTRSIVEIMQKFDPAQLH